MGVQLKPFLKQPKILPDEFLLSYLIRTSAANHYDSLETFKSVIHEYSAVYGVKDTLYNPVRPETYKVLSTLCGIPDHELFQHTIHKFADIFIPCTEKQENITFCDGSTHHLSDHETHRRNCRPLLNAAFCPDCLKESEYYRLDWHILSTTACLKHNVLLVDTCDNCGCNLAIGDIVSCRCPKCQFDLRASKTMGIEQDHLSVMTQRILSSWMGIGEPLDVIQGVSPVTLYRVFTGLKYCIQTKANWNYLHPYPNYQATKPSKMELAKWVVPNKYLHRLNVTAVKALLDFPNGMYEFWSAYREVSKSQSNIGLGLGYLYWGWIDKRWLAPEFEFIQMAYNEFLVENQEILYPPIAKSQRLLKNPELVTRFKYITMATAADILDTYKMTVEKMVKAGHLRGKEVSKGKNKFVVLTKDVEAMVLKLASSVNLLTTIELLGTTNTVVLSLIHGGLLETVRTRSLEDSYSWTITIDSISVLQERLAKTVTLCRCDNGKKKISDVAKQLAGWGIDVSDLFSMVLNRKIEAFLESENDTALSSLYLSEDTAEIIKKELIIHNKWISHIEFANKIGVKPNIVSRWINSGLIESSKNIGRTIYFTYEELTKFEANNLTTKDASDILGVGALTVQKWARTGRLTPVSGTDVDGCHEYRFTRVEIEKLKADNRVTAPKMAKRLGISRSQMSTRIRQGKIKPISGPGIDGAKQYLFLSQE